MPKTTNTSRGPLATNALDPEYQAELEEKGKRDARNKARREKRAEAKQAEEPKKAAPPPLTGPEPSDDAPGAWEQAQKVEAKDAAPEDIDEPGSNWKDATLAVNDPNEPKHEKGDDVSDGNSSSESESSNDKPGEKNSNDGPPPVTAPTAGLRSSKTAEAKSAARSTGGSQTKEKK